MGMPRTLSLTATRLLVAAALAVTTAVAAPPAGAVKPKKVEFPVEVSYEIPELTELCGVEVWFQLEGTFKGLVYYDKSGAIVREVNSQPDTWLMLYSPETGRSIRNPFATRFHYRYPEGTDPGDRVVIVATGYLEKLPGMPARAGRSIFPNGELISVDDGVPIVEYGEPASDTPGIYKYGFDEADATLCEFLRG